jgi:hypothetical protein
MFYVDNCFTCGRVTNHDLTTEKCAECSLAKKTKKFNFVIFKNYDGTVTSKVIPRETWDRINA